ncbi:MAG: hypothetical protein ACK2U4_04960, partial [Candidatus Promineifilaceae bacterium]
GCVHTIHYPLIRGGTALAQSYVMGLGKIKKPGTIATFTLAKVREMVNEAGNLVCLLKDRMGELHTESLRSRKIQYRLKVQ